MAWKLLTSNCNVLHNILLKLLSQKNQHLPVLLAHLCGNTRPFPITSVVCLSVSSRLLSSFAASRTVNRQWSRICSLPLWQRQLSKATHGNISLGRQLASGRMLCPPKKYGLWPQMHSIKAVLWTCDNSINLFINKFWTLS